MLRHTVLLAWQDGTTEEQLRALMVALAELPDKISTIRSYQFGPDAGLDTDTYDFAVVADFDDEAGYLYYRDHDAHQALIDTHVRPIVARRASMEFHPHD